MATNFEDSQLMVYDDKASLIANEELQCHLDAPTTSRKAPEMCEVTRPNKKGLHALATCLLVTSATLACISLPCYLGAINGPSDVYCAILVTSSGHWVISLVTVAVAFALRTDTDRTLTTLIPPVSARTVLKLGTSLALAGMAFMYGRDRNRVICHLQDPLTAAVLPWSVVCHFCFGPKVDASRKLFCIAGAIIGLFICIDFQIWDEFRCHGQNLANGPDCRTWSTDEHAVWTVVYLSGLGLLAFFYTCLERELRGKRQPEMTVATIPLSPCATTSVVIDSPTNPGKPLLSLEPLFLSPRTISAVQIAALTVWIQTVVVISVILLFWTDLFPAIGKAGSYAEFDWMLRSGVACHFGLGEECGNLATAAWPFIISSAVFVTSSIYLLAMSPSCSSAYVVAVFSTAIPLSVLSWSFFQANGPGLRWQPVFTGETGFTALGLPVMAISLGFYRHYASKEVGCH